MNLCPNYFFWPLLIISVLWALPFMEVCGRRQIYIRCATQAPGHLYMINVYKHVHSSVQKVLKFFKKLGLILSYPWSGCDVSGPLCVCSWTSDWTHAVVGRAEFFVPVCWGMKAEKVVRIKVDSLESMLNWLNSCSSLTVSSSSSWSNSIVMQSFIPAIIWLFGQRVTRSIISSRLCLCIESVTLHCCIYLYLSI